MLSSETILSAVYIFLPINYIQSDLLLCYSEQDTMITECHQEEHAKLSHEHAMVCHLVQPANNTFHLYSLTITSAHCHSTPTRLVTSLRQTWTSGPITARCLFAWWLSIVTVSSPTVGGRRHRSSICI